MHARFPYLWLALFIMVPLTGCLESDSNSKDRQATLSLAAPSQAQRVVVEAGDKLVSLVAGQEEQLDIPEGQEFTLSIRSHSPLLQCGFVPDLSRQITLRAGQSHAALVDCAFIDVLATLVSIEGHYTKKTVVTDGSTSGTSILSDSGIVTPQGAYGDSLIFSKNQNYLWTQGAHRSLVPTAWKTSGAITTLYEGQLFALFEDEQGGARIDTAWAPDNALSLFTKLPTLTSGYRYTRLKVIGNSLIAFSYQGDVENLKFQAHLIALDSPESIRGPIAVPEELVFGGKPVGHALYASALDQEQHIGKLYVLDGETASSSKWRVPVERIQRLKVWAQKEHSRVLAGVEYLGGDNKPCAAIYQFKKDNWQPLRDFCETHTGIDLYGWSVWDKTLHMGASAESGPLIPSDPALVVIDDILAPKSPTTVVSAEQFKGSVRDSIPSLSGGFFYTFEKTEAGCPAAPWGCLYTGRLYFFETGSTPAVTQVFEGLFNNGFVTGPPILSDYRPRADSVTFTSSSGEMEMKLWRSDGTVSGTYLMKDLTPESDPLTFFFPLEGP
ncbi:hypothetical protein QQM79_05445 [Marinobacteraceae bacterium S3BR75-40.1]